MSNSKIIIAACIFGGRYGVTVEPRTVDRPMREFRSLSEAAAHAERLRQQHGWEIIDQTGGNHE